MPFNLKKKKPFDNISRILKKLLTPEIYDRFKIQVNGESHIDELSDNFLPILTKWSFEAAYHLFTEQGIFSAIDKGKTVKELLFDLDWKNTVMLEDLLDTFVDQEILVKKGREYQPLAISERTGTLTVSKLAELSLKEVDNRWLDRASHYRPLFTFYNKLISDHVLETLEAGNPTAMLEGTERSPLSTIFDSLSKTPAYVIPRMAAVASGITIRHPKSILDLNCSTGRGIEEILLCQPDTELILGVDSNSHHIEIAKRNVAIAVSTNGIQDDAVFFQTIDYSCSLNDQLSEYSGMFDMILIDQFPMWTSEEIHALLAREIWSLMRPDGVIVVYQPFRPESACPWPHEWILRVLNGFHGYPDEFKFLKLFKQRAQAIIPTLAYLISA